MGSGTVSVGVLGKKGRHHTLQKEAHIKINLLRPNEITLHHLLLFKTMGSI